MTEQEAISLREIDTRMTLEEFLVLERDHLDEFERFWCDNAAATPDEFPAKMEPGEWDQQLLAFEQ